MKLRTCIAIAIFAAISSATRVKTEVDTDPEYFLPSWVRTAEYKNGGSNTSSSRPPSNRRSSRSRSRRSRSSRRRSYSDDSDSDSDAEQATLAAPVQISEPEIEEVSDPVVHPEDYSK